jgi:hypothetical protein
MTAAAVLLAILPGLLTGCASAPLIADGFTAAPGPPLPLAAKELRPGLAVLYFKHPFVRDLDALPRGEDAREQGWRGAPIPHLDHRFGRGPVFESGTNRGIALEMSGYIRLERTGTYSFQANTNDGFRLSIDGRRLIDDPLWHADRFSPEARLTILEPGWYSMRIRYFQRKGTATLQLYWQPPGEPAYAIVPAGVLAHGQSY